MRFFRSLQPFKVISFDLDDTLYDNYPVIMAAEHHFLQRLQELTGYKLTMHEWRGWKSIVAEENPLLVEDVVAWRLEALQCLLQHYTFSTQQIQKISEHCMAEFVIWRHKIDVPKQSLQVLDKLRQHYALVALSNGNVEPQRIGFNQFELILRGGVDGRAKPHPQLFETIAQHFTIAPQAILHVGDNLNTDVEGAIAAGCQAVWLNTHNSNLYHSSEGRLLPHVEIDDLVQLTQFCLLMQ